MRFAKRAPRVWRKTAFRCGRLNRQRLSALEMWHECQLTIDALLARRANIA